MAAAPFVDTGDEIQKMVNKWMLAGHEVIPERLTFRHRLYKLDIPPETVLRDSNGVEVLDCGDVVRIGNLLPERTDIAVTIDGKLRDTRDFVERYKEYNRWFQMIEGSDPESEPIPDPLDFVLAVPDSFSESNGMVSVNYDARKKADEHDETMKYDPNEDRMVKVETAVEKSTEVLGALMEELTRRKGGRPRKDQEA